MEYECVPDISFMVSSVDNDASLRSSTFLLVSGADFLCHICRLRDKGIFPLHIYTSIGGGRENTEDSPRQNRLFLFLSLFFTSYKT